MLFIYATSSICQKHVTFKSLSGILDVNCLTSPNYMDWLRNLRIVFMVEKIAYVLNIVMPTPEEGASKDEITCYVKYINDSTHV